MYPVRRQISPHAARLRRDQTDAEAKLWAVVRNRQLDGFKFRRQATIGNDVADFLCVEAMLIVEVDGGQHDAETDAARTRRLEGAGYRVVRFWNNDVIDNLEGVVAHLAGQLAASSRRRPSPNPLP